jgi:plastocyanin
VPAGQVNEFLPGVIHARVGQKVQWSIDGVHTISFGEPATPAPFIQVAPDGSVHLNPDEAAPNPPPPAGKAPAPPANGPPPAQHIDTGRWDGTGIRSSGFVPSVGPAPDTWSLSFGKAGTYNYVCLIHPGMSGQVIVA